MFSTLACVFLLIFLCEGSKLDQSRTKAAHKYANYKDSACTSCVSYLTQTIDQLIDIIEDFGIAGGCEVLCARLGMFFCIQYGIDS
jgi:hypothetical protein